MNNNYQKVAENTEMYYVDDNYFVSLVDKLSEKMYIPEGRYPIAFCSRTENNGIVIVFNRDDMNCLSLIHKDFIIGHEVAHAVGIEDEIGADEWSLDFLQERGYNRCQIMNELWYEMEIFQDLTHYQ